MLSGNHLLSTVIPRQPDERTGGDSKSRVPWRPIRHTIPYQPDELGGEIHPTARALGADTKP